ncbi:MAG: TonB-dependent receptor [Candidatus Cyclobacteriaceae bacterium M3_2C_046]
MKILYEKLLGKVLLTFLMVCFSLLQVVANEQALQEIKVNLNFKDKALEEVLTDIEAQSKFVFFYNNKDVDLNRKVDIAVKNASLSDALDLLFKNEGISFNQVGNQIILKRMKHADKTEGAKEGFIQKRGLIEAVHYRSNNQLLNVIFQNRTVNGTVTDGTGEGLPGVNIVEKGTLNGTVSGVDGSYRINVGENATLVFSSVGYQTQEVTIGNRSVIDLQMQEDVTQLEELVVVGYGAVKKSDLTGSVSSIKPEDIGNIAVQNIGQMIQGRAAGVNVITNNGLPGSGVKIKVRGTGTIYNSNPLYVIDGMPGDINTISPQDIESIEILKDASATAIYGARAANGVVLVTTKKGKVGEPRISYHGYYGVATPGKKLDMLNAPQYMDLIKDVISNTGTTQLDLPVKLQDPSYVNVDRTDWQDAIFRRGAITEHHINIGGGTESVKYNFSTGYTEMDANGGDYKYKRYNGLANAEFNLINERLRIGENFAIRFENRLGNSPDFTGALRMPPYAPARDPYNVGGWARVTSAEDLNDAYNPLTGIYLTDQDDEELKIRGQVYAEFDIIPSLTIRSQLLLENWWGHNYDFNEEYLNGNVRTPNGLSEDYYKGFSPQWENYLTYTEEFDIHSITAMVGNTYQRGGFSRRIEVEGSNFESTQVLLPTFADQYAITNAGAGVSAYMSYYGRVNYVLMDKYLFTFNYRTDASPKFAPDNRWGSFPSFALGWKMHEEAFMQNIPLISTAKLRLSWGKSGNDRIPSYGFLSNIYTGSRNNIIYPLGINNEMYLGATINGLPAPYIQWETSESINGALELGLIEDRLLFTAEYYNRLTDGILVRVPIPRSTGIDNAPFKNAAEVENNGMEFILTYLGNAGELSYNISANGGFNSNEVKSLGEGNPIPNGSREGTGAITLTDVGHPVGAFYGFKVDRVLSTEAEAQQYRDTYGEENAKAGDIAFQDISGPEGVPDGRIDDNDKTFIGDPNPDFTYGMNFSASYRNLDLQFSFTGQAGNEIFNYIGVHHLQGMRRPFNHTTEVLNRWKAENDVTDIPRATQDDKNLNTRVSDRYIESGSFMRMRNITLGYSMPFANENSIIKRMRFYVTGENLFTLTSYSGYDPEISAIDPNNDQNYNMFQGIDTGQFPQPRRVFAGVQLTF